MPSRQSLVAISKPTMPTLCTRVSELTGKVNSMKIHADKHRVREWRSTPLSERPHIQNAFPELDDDEREFLLSGITPDEWDSLLPKEED